MNRTKIKFADTLTGKESIEELQKMKIYMEADNESTLRLNLSISAFFNTSFLAKIAHTFQKSNVDIMIDLDEADVKNRGCVFDEKETAAVKAYSDFLNKYIGSESRISLFDSATNTEYKIDEVVSANNMIDDWSNSINRATVDGRPLSPLEKYAMAFELITEFKFNEEGKKEGYSKSRGVVDVLNGDKIVCAGFANLLVALCKKIGIPCINLGVNLIGRLDKNGNTLHDENGDVVNGGGHAVVLAYIKDELYGVNDIGLGDPTTKSATNMFLSLEDYKEVFRGRYGTYLTVHFAKEGGHPVDVDSDQLNFIMQTDKNMQKEQAEFIKAKKQERKENIENDPRRSRQSTSEFLEQYYDMCEAGRPREERLKFVSENMEDIGIVYGFLDPARADEFFLRTLDKRFDSFLKSKNEKRSLKDFWLQELVGTRINADLTRDDKIEKTLKTKSIPLRKIEDAFYNVFRSDEFYAQNESQHPRISALNKTQITLSEISRSMQRGADLEIIANRFKRDANSSEMLKLLLQRKAYHDDVFVYALNHVSRFGKEFELLGTDISYEEAQQI